MVNTFSSILNKYTRISIAQYCIKYCLNLEFQANLLGSSREKYTDPLSVSMRLKKRYETRSFGADYKLKQEMVPGPKFIDHRPGVYNQKDASIFKWYLGNLEREREIHVICYLVSEIFGCGCSTHRREGEDFGRSRADIGLQCHRRRNRRKDVILYTALQFLKM